MLKIRQIIENTIPIDDHKYTITNNAVDLGTNSLIGEPSGGRPANNVKLQ